jgi:ubiquinone/menaquinone biosynthesis C-methylase UbiE
MTEEYWSRFPNTYEKNQEYVVGKQLLDEITRELNRLPELGQLVELGCGTGCFTETIAVKTKSMFATDISDTLLEAAKTRIGEHPKITVQKEDCKATSFPPEAFDSVFMANLIHVVDNPGKALRECNRILRNGGIIVIVTFTGHGMKLWEKIKMIVRFAKAWGRPPAHTRSFSPDDLAGMMKDAGFAVERTTVIGARTKALFAIGRKDSAIHNITPSSSSESDAKVKA